MRLGFAPHGGLDRHGRFLIYEILALTEPTAHLQRKIRAPQSKTRPHTALNMQGRFGERSLVSILTAQPESGIIQRMRMMLEYSLYRWMANPPEKRLLINRRGWYETTEFWTPKTYKEIIAPTIRKEAELVHQAGRKYGYIITSAFLPLLDDIVDTDIDVLIGLREKRIE